MLILKLLLVPLKTLSGLAYECISDLLTCGTLRSANGALLVTPRSQLVTKGDKIWPLEPQSVKLLFLLELCVNYTVFT